MEKKSTPEVRRKRKQLSAQRKGFADITELNEGVAYGAGLFWLFWYIFEFISTFEWNNIYFFILETSLFIYIVLFKNDIFKKYDMQKVL